MSLKFDASRFVNREMSSFYSAFPPPPLLHATNHSIYGRMPYLDGDVWQDRPEEQRKLYSTDKNRNSYFSAFMGPINRNLEKDHTKYLELDLSSTHQQDKHSPLSPSEYYRRRDILSNGSSSHSTSPCSPLSTDQSNIRQIVHVPSKNSSEPYSPKSNGIMEKSDQDGVINLSTSPKDVKDHLPNGDIIRNGDSKEETQFSGPHSPQEFTSKHNNNVNLSSSSSTIQSAAKRKTKSNSAIELNTAAQPLMMMAAAQHSMMPQQLQHLLQQNQGMTSQQLQQMMQHQSILLQHQQQQKLQEQALQELNEQLQLNVVQQSQLMQQQQADKNKSGKAQQQLQQLALQQQQLIQQIQGIQIQQRQFLLASLVQPFGLPQGMMSPSEIQQLWKEVAVQSGLDPDATHKSNFNGLGNVMPSPPSQAQWANGLLENFHPAAGGLPNNPTVTMDTEDKSSTSKQSILYRHGVCKWPGCDTACEDQNAFQKHLNSEHTLDDRSTAQARVQMQVVSQLEIQLSREKELLQGMMQHLHMKPHESKSEASQKSVPNVSTPLSPLPLTSHFTACTPSPPKPIISSPIKLQPNMTTLHSSSVSAPPTPLPIISNQMSLPLAIPHPLATSLSKPPTSQSQSSSQPSTPTGGGPMRRRVSDKCNLPISAEIQRNRDFYKSTDVRPPFTYASLIRQAIIESPHKQLTLNEIYQWFQNTFAYFRRNEATWKNAVRHNLSLHKCFMRVENVKGAVWTVDEIEFYKRRPQKLGGFEDDFGSFWMVDDLEFVRRRHLTRGRPRKFHDSEKLQSISLKDVKSPSMATDPSLFGENLNASLRAALEHANLLSHQYSNGSLTMDGVEDLSMKSSRNSSSGSPKLESPSQEEFPEIKEEMDDDFSKDEACLENGHPSLGNQIEMDIKDEEEEDEDSELLDQSDNDRSIKSEPSLMGHCTQNQEVFSHSVQKQEGAVSLSEPVGS